MTAISLDPSPARRDTLTRRIRLLVAATITYSVIEAVVAITAGTLASSTALIGFGLDSVIEVSSAAAVAWQFSARDHAVREAREQRTLRIIAVSFFALAAYVSVDSVRALTGTGEADHSIPGIVLAAISPAITPFLSAAQRKAGRELGSASAVADSKQTLRWSWRRLKAKRSPSSKSRPQATNVVDLMQVLQSSLDQAATAGGEQPAAPRKGKPTPQKATVRKPAGKAAKKAAPRKAPPKQAQASTQARGRGTGKSELRQLSKAELYQRAADQGIEGRSKMSRDQLIEALARAGRRRKKSAA
jgi:hypothetical protein